VGYKQVEEAMCGRVGSPVAGALGRAGLAVLSLVTSGQATAQVRPVSAVSEVATAAPPPGTDLDCYIRFLPATVIPGVGSLSGTAYANCSVAPDRHVMVLSLQQRQGGAWVTVASAPPDSTIPRPRATYQVKTPCFPGAWRISARATGNLWHQPFDFTKYSVERIISAQDCTRGK
jgi:hypothetical protein